MIDWTRVTELREDIGAEAFAEVVEIFLDEVDGAMTDLGSDPGQLEAQLHFLKGSALNLGFATFCALCQEGERQVGEGETSLDIPAIIASYNATRAAFLEGLEIRFAA